MDTIILAASALLAATHARAAWRPAHILGRAATRAVWHHRHGPLPIPIPSPAAASQTAQAQSGLLACGVLVIISSIIWVHMARRLACFRIEEKAEREAAERAREDLAAKRTDFESAFNNLADQRLAIDAVRQDTAAMKAEIEATRVAVHADQTAIEAARSDAAGQLAAAEAARKAATAKDGATEAVQRATDALLAKADALVREAEGKRTAAEAAQNEVAALQAAAEVNADLLADATERASTLSNRIDELERRWNAAQAPLEADIRAALERAFGEEATPAESAAAEREASERKIRELVIRFTANLDVVKNNTRSSDAEISRLRLTLLEDNMEHWCTMRGFKTKLSELNNQFAKTKQDARELLGAVAGLRCQCTGEGAAERSNALSDFRRMLQ
ncbi:hypothetical protein H4R19_001678 [Coemansia spiralis]|nr:hypothetical protein H4R19_001678 [Coemansia spiralis]